MSYCVQMSRPGAPRLLVLGVVMLIGRSAAAEPVSTAIPPDGRVMVPTPDSAFVTAPHAPISSTLFLNRCAGGCSIVGGSVNDARSNMSTIPNPGRTYTVGEFRADGQVGAAADTEWNAVVQCIRDVYSPYQVTVTDTRPSAGAYHMAIVAGLPEEVGWPAATQGVAPGSCNPQDNVISFSFANAHPGTGTDRVLNLCWTVAQESAHSFGLPDHAWEFADGRSACNDPMTYRTDCGGQKFFRNADASCGDFAPGSCRCGSTQNSHRELIDVFGPGTPSTGAPTSVITLPLPDTQLGAVVGVQAGSRRGIAKVQLRVNGFKWAEVKGTPFGANGQANPGTYAITVPSNLPDGIVDLVARACDDLGACTDSAVVTATKGVPCTSADTCAERQHCEAGKCLWDPAAGELGDSCSFDQTCVSEMCSPTVENRICTQTCSTEMACPSGFDCLKTTAGDFCYLPDGGGCCSAGDRAHHGYLQGGLSALVLALVVRRRRRR